MNIDGKTDKQLQRMSVNHWKRMLKLSVGDIKSDKERPSPVNCAFCVKYYGDDWRDCVGCPVTLKVGGSVCLRTPYDDAFDLYTGIAVGIHRKLKTFHKAVQKEIEFLESLDC